MTVINISETVECFWTCNNLRLIQGQIHTVSSVFLGACTYPISHDTEALILNTYCIHILLSVVSHQPKPKNSAWNTSILLYILVGFFTVHAESSATIETYQFNYRRQNLLFSTHPCLACKYQIIYLQIVLFLFLKLLFELLAWVL